METIVVVLILTALNVLQLVLNQRIVSQLTDKLLAKDLTDYKANTKDQDKEEMLVEDSGLRAIDDPEIMQALNDEIYGTN